LKGAFIQRSILVFLSSPITSHLGLGQCVFTKAGMIFDVIVFLRLGAVFTKSMIFDVFVFLAHWAVRFLEQNSIVFLAHWAVCVLEQNSK
jgi:hypothetical protein